MPTLRWRNGYGMEGGLLRVARDHASTAAFHPRPSRQRFAYGVRSSSRQQLPLEAFVCTRQKKNLFSEGEREHCLATCMRSMVWIALRCGLRAAHCGALASLIWIYLRAVVVAVAHRMYERQMLTLSTLYLA